MWGPLPLTEPALAVERIGRTYPQVFTQAEQDRLPIYILDVIQRAGYMWGYGFGEIFTRL